MSELSELRERFASKWGVNWDPEKDLGALCTAGYFWENHSDKRWEDYPEIEYPYGLLPFEWLARFCLAMLPIALAAWAYAWGDALPLAHPKATSAFLALVPSIVLWRHLHEKLEARVEQEVRAAWKADFGRYDLQLKLAYRSRVPPFEFDEKVVKALAEHFFKAHYPRLKREYENTVQARKDYLVSRGMLPRSAVLCSGFGARNAMWSFEDPEGKYGRSGRSVTGSGYGAVAGAVAGYAAGNSWNDDDDAPSSTSWSSGGSAWSPAFNVDGAPMMGGGFDVHGRVYGDSSTSSYGGSNDW